ncbi:MAG: TolC family protein [Planctomycetales bacterium]
MLSPIASQARRGAWMCCVSAGLLLAGCSATEFMQASPADSGKRHLFSSVAPPRRGRQASTASVPSLLAHTTQLAHKTPSPPRPAAQPMLGLATQSTVRTPRVPKTGFSLASAQSHSSPASTPFAAVRKVEYLQASPSRIPTREQLRDADSRFRSPAVSAAPSRDGLRNQVAIAGVFQAEPVKIDSKPLPKLEDGPGRFPIDLPTSLRLAGANNVQIALAAERVREARARWASANARWLPNINLGVGYNNHAGRIQETEGSILEVSRSSLFAGGGAALDNGPLAGGSGGPFRRNVDVSWADAMFDPLAARHATAAAGAERTATFNDVLLQVALTHQELVKAQTQLAVARETVVHTQSLVDLTDSLYQAGAGLQADVQRSRAELARRQRLVLSAEERIGVVSAELVRLLRLDPCTVLVASDSQPCPLSLVNEDEPLCNLIASALASRPETRRSRALLNQSYTRVRQEHWRPWLPNFHLGAGGGVFGGGMGSHQTNFSDRTDLDLQAVWQVRNLGMGPRTAQREALSRNRQASLGLREIRDLVAAQVSAAHYRVRSRREQVEVARGRIQLAADALGLNLTGIQARELRAIEAQQAIQALDSARTEYLDAIVRYNQAQFELLRSIGVPPTEGSAPSPPPMIQPPMIQPPRDEIDTIHESDENGGGIAPPEIRPPLPPAQANVFPRAKHPTRPAAYQPVPARQPSPSRQAPAAYQPSPVYQSTAAPTCPSIGFSSGAR